MIDAVAEDVKFPELYRRLEHFRPDLIFAESATPSLKSDLRMLHEFRRRFARTTIVCGGIHDANMVPDVIKSEGIPDYWLAGEYDFALLELVRRIGQGLDLGEVPGLINGTDIMNPPAVVPDVNRLPSPLFEQLPITNYSDPVCGLPHPCIQTWLSRGCPFGCTFCVWPQIIYNNSSKYRRRNVDRTLEEIEHLIGQYGCESFYFDDDTTNIGEDRMLELSTKIKDRGLNAFPWGMMARGDCMNERMIDALADSGMYCIKYGVESISKELIDVCNKKTRVERLKNAIRYSQSAGIKVHLTFTFGLPGETPETIRETMDFAKEIDPESAQFSICTPFPGTKFFHECKEKGYLITDDWDRYLGSGEAVVETPWLSAERLEEEFQKLTAEWEEFTQGRLRRRQRKLLNELVEKLDTGIEWTLLGDIDFAQFLWDKGGERVADAFADDEDSVIGNNQKQLVIVSEHDEEKIWRRIKREKSPRSGGGFATFWLVRITFSGHVMSF